MAGSVDLMLRVSTGIEARGDVLRLHPELPKEIERLDMRIRYRGHSLNLSLRHDSLTIRGSDSSALPISLCIHDTFCEFVSNDTRVFSLAPDDKKSHVKKEGELHHENWDDGA